jgi:hypothetical protein
MSWIASERIKRTQLTDWQPSEEQEQMAVIEWRDLMLPQFPDLEDLIHIPNGGWRSKPEAARFKRLGVQPGVSDLFLPAPRGKYHGLWIEMKRRQGGKLSPAQKDWLDRMNRKGYLALRADGAEEACEILYKYLTEAL